MADKFSRFPETLRTRDGWSAFLELQRPIEPHVHQIEPTNHCPYSCIMCPRPRRMTRTKGFMDFGLYQKVIDEIATFSEPVRSKEIELFHFGESLLHPQIDRMVAYAARQRLNVVLSVNAPELTPGRAEQILAAGPARLIISLDGHNQESYSRIRGPFADFAKAVSNIKYLSSLLQQTSTSPAVCLRIIRLKETEPDLERFRRMWQESGIPVEIRPFFPWSEHDMVQLGEVELYPPGMPCPFPWQYLVVQWDGTVVPCCRDYNGVNSMGNVRNLSLREIWGNPGYAAFRQQHQTGRYDGNDFCRHCMDIYYDKPSAEDEEARKEIDQSIDFTAVMTAAPQTLPALWRKAVSSYADRPLMVNDDDNGALTYGEAETLVGIIRKRLAAVGICQGDLIVLISPLHPEAVLVFWAAAMLGAIVVPLDHRLVADSITSLLNRLNPKMLFCDHERPGLPANRKQIPTVLFDDPLMDGPAGGNSFSAWLENAPSDFTIEFPEISPDDPALVLFTSGTSGEPKGVTLSHGALCRSGSLMASAYGWKPDDVIFSLGDPHTMSGLRNPTIAVLHAGCSFLIASPQKRSSAVAVGDCVQSRGVTVLTTVPAMLRQFVNVAERIPAYALASLRQILCTGTVLPITVIDNFEAQFRVPVLNYYGLTETAGICAGELPGNFRHEPGGIGVPLGCEVRIVGADGKTLRPGEKGELHIRTANRLIGYHGDPLQVGKSFDGDWYRSGDLAYMTPEGQLILLERMGDMIKDAQGEFVVPAEIEHLLELHPEVAEAGVVPVRDAEGSVDLVTLIVLQPANELTPELVEELRHHVARKLGPARVPSSIRRIELLPRGTNGKLLRRRLRELINEQD